MISTSAILGFIGKISFKAFSSFINKSAWDGYFLYACEIVKEIKEEDAKALANYLYKKSSLKVLPSIREELSNRGYETATIEAYLNAFVDNIKDKNPIIYLLFKTEPLENFVLNNKQRIDVLEKQIKFLQNNPQCNLNYYNIDEYDNYLKQCSRDNDGSPCLDIFNFEDPEFTSDISTVLSKESNPILICGEYQRETFLATLCELKKAFPDDYLDKVYIFNSSEDYMKALSIELPEGAILINSFFNADSIPVVSKCINIHIVSKWKSKDSSIRLRPRMIASIKNGLERNGFSSDVVSKIIRKRKNVFSYLFRELFKETDNYETKIIESIDKKIIVTALLVNKFSLTNKNDVDFIEALSGYSIDDFVDRAKPASLIETPFVKIIDDYGHKQVVVLDFEELFRLFSNLITKSLVDRFFELTKKALCTLPERYTNKQYIRTRDEIMHSTEFLNSVLESLLFFTISGRFKKQCFDIVKSFILWIEESNTSEHYKYLADYLNVLTEISPSLINKKISDDIANQNGLWHLFVQREKDDFLFPREKYVEVLWAMEKLLFINEEREQTVLSLFELYRLSIKYRLANNPGNSLKTFFVAWIQTTPAKKEEKNVLCEKLFSIDSNAAWSLFADLLYSGGGETITPFNGPRYIQYERFTNQICRKDIIDLYKYYNDITINKANTPEQVAKLIDKHSYIYFGEESIKKTIRKIKTVCNDSDDNGKEIIANGLRSYIHDNRKFKDSNWAVSETILSKLERVLRGINYLNPEMGYIHLFNNYDVDEPHPIPFDHGDYDHSLNESNKEKYINQCYKRFVANNLRVDFLYKYFDDKVGSVSVNYRFYTFAKRIEIDLNKKSFQEFAETLIEKTPHLYNVFAFLGRDLFDNHRDIYYSIASFILDSSDNKLLALEYLYSGFVDLTQSDYKEYYLSLSDDCKYMYWKHFRSHANINYLDKNTVCFVMDNLKTIPGKDSINNPYLEILFFFSMRYKENDVAEIVLKYLSDIDMDYIHLGHYSYLPELLDLLHSKYAFTENIDIEAKIACLEMIAIKGDEGRKAICLKNLLARQPDLYFSFVDNMYIHQTKDKQHMENLFYLLQFSLKFCPGYVNGVFNEDIFKYWIEKYKELVYATDFKDKDWLYYSTLGKLFKHALPEGELPMPKAIINLIEGLSDEKHLKELNDYYCIETTNTLGVRTITDGSDLIAKGKQYEKMAVDLENLGYVKTSQIFHSLAEEFINKGNLERKRAEDEW